MDAWIQAPRAPLLQTWEKGNHTLRCTARLLQLPQPSMAFTTHQRTRRHLRRQPHRKHALCASLPTHPARTHLTSASRTIDFSPPHPPPTALPLRAAGALTALRLPALRNLADTRHCLLPATHRRRAAALLRHIPWLDSILSLDGLTFAVSNSAGTLPPSTTHSLRRVSACSSRHRQGGT